jgi:hypothetical protein
MPSSAVISAGPTEKILRFDAYGAAAELFRCRAREVVVSGPAGTGKSRACLEKVHAQALKYPGVRALLTRKTLTSLATGGIVTYEKKVLVVEDRVAYFGGSPKEPPQYRYPNGSVVVIGGLDKADKVMSSEYDVIYVQEITEITEDEHQMLTTRMRNNVMPYQQLLGDCNPQGPKHWVKQRADAKRLVLLESRHEDNPVYFDRLTRQWTEVGLAYLAGLDGLTGVHYKRLREGIWAAAEGMVYDGWDPLLHRVPPSRLPVGWRTWPRAWVVDFGYTNPFVWQDWARDPDGRLWRLREIYHTQRLVEEHCKDILRLSGRKMLYSAEGRPTGQRVNITEDPEPLPQVIICDHDAEDRATMERHLGLRTAAAYKAIRPGVQAVAARLKPAGDGKPRLFFVDDGEREDAPGFTFGLVQRDESLANQQNKPPCRTEEEMESYIWDTSAGRRKGEEPVDKDNHGEDTTRYMVAAADDIHRRTPKSVAAKDTAA